jgi:hypothetical protein
MADKIPTTPRRRRLPAPTVFMCRWPSGTVSVVVARDKVSARELLDEFNWCDLDMLEPLPGFLINFRVGDDGRPAINGIGEVCVLEIEAALGITHDDDE